MLTTRWHIGVMLVLLAVSPASGQRREYPENERFDKLGTRPPPLPPGEGGGLIVTAPAQLCGDATRELRIRYFPPEYQSFGLTGGTAIRLLAGPSRCQWEFDALAAGEYDAVIQGREDGRIVATAARRQVVPGVTGVMTLEPIQTEIEGVLAPEGLSWDQIPLPEGLHIVFTQELNEWTAPLDANGNYGVKLGTDQRVCMKLARTPRLNVLSLGCQTFYPGLQRLDFTHVQIPQGVIRLEVPPVNNAGLGEFVLVTVAVSAGKTGVRTGVTTWMSGFKLLHGLRGQFFADLDREYRITVTPCSRTCTAESPVLASAQFTLSSENPIRDVTLSVASLSNRSKGVARRAAGHQIAALQVTGKDADPLRLALSERYRRAPLRRSKIHALTRAPQNSSDPSTMTTRPAAGPPSRARVSMSASFNASKTDTGRAERNNRTPTPGSRNG